MKRKAAGEFPESEWIGGAMYDEKPSAMSDALVYFVCASLAAATLAFGMVDSISLGIFAVGAGVVGWLWLADAWRAQEFHYSSSLLPLPILGFIVIGLVQLLPLRNVALPNDLLAQPPNAALSLDAFATKLMIAQFAAMLIYFAAALTFINNQKRLRLVTGFLVVFGLVMAVIGILQFLGGDGRALWTRASSQALPFASFINRHHFGAFMVMVMGLALGLIYTGALKSEKRVLHVFAVVIMGVGLIMTSSRGALLSLFGVLAFLTAAVYLRRNKDEEERDKSSLKNRLALVGGGLALIFVIFAAVVLLGGDNLLLRSVGISTAGQQDPSSGRLHFWQTTLQIIRDYPLTGVGLNAFGAAYTRYDTWNGTYRVEQAHNEYLQILAETGIVGLVLTAAFIYFLFRRGWQVFSTTRDPFRRGIALGALAGCLGIIIHSFFDFPLRTPSNFLTFLILAALATVHISHPKIYRRKTKTREEAQ